MDAAAINHKARGVIRRSRVTVGLLLLGSMAALLIGPALVGRMDAGQFLSRLLSPAVLALLGLFYLIYLPASLRIYYVLLLGAKGVFSAPERQYFLNRKQRWEKYLFRASLLAGVLAIGLAVVLRWHR